MGSEAWFVEDGGDRLIQKVEGAVRYGLLGEAPLELPPSNTALRCETVSVSRRVYSEVHVLRQIRPTSFMEDDWCVLVDLPASFALRECIFSS